MGRNLSKIQIFGSNLEQIPDLGGHENLGSIFWKIQI